MSDEMLQRLEEQLRDAHAANAELREKIQEANREASTGRAYKAEHDLISRQMESVYAKQKAAEENAAAAQRKAQEFESKALRAQERFEALEEKHRRTTAEADRLAELNSRIAKAQHVSDLFS